ncbi:MAG: hypothetical protein JXB36_19475 [Gammaproteobacteria bacterium]|nr:hypothetical protein [Gammaproteobacteria bacterium]
MNRIRRGRSAVSGTLLILYGALASASAGAQEQGARDEEPREPATRNEEDSPVDTQALAQELLSRAQQEDSDDARAEGGLSPGRQGQLEMFAAMLKELSAMPEEERQALFRSARQFMDSWRERSEADAAGDEDAGADRQQE